MLQMAVLNLLSNAFKYGGRPRAIHVRVDAAADRKTVRISVRDNGEGIPPSEHKRIFQKVYRRDDRLSRMTEGSGLGLAIVNKIVEEHGGAMAFAPAPDGQGTRVTMRFARDPMASSGAGSGSEGGSGGLGVLRGAGQLPGHRAAASQV